MLWRGARRRCPWCNGRGAFFHGWFHKEARCRTCGLGWQRGYEGFELGALGVSTIVVFVALVAGLGIAIAATAPDIRPLPIIGVLGSVAIVLPVVFYPFGYTIWQAIDLAMHPPDTDDPATPSPRR
jgi:uncharacterized protein (DUF983 family)